MRVKDFVADVNNWVRGDVFLLHEYNYSFAAALDVAHYRDPEDPYALFALAFPYTVVAVMGNINSAVWHEIRGEPYGSN